MVAVLKSMGEPTQADFHEAIASRGDRWYSACLSITRNAAMAEDAVQDALLNAWNKRDQFEQSARLDTWIHRIAINSALMQIRKSKPGVYEPLEVEIEDHTLQPETLHADRELEGDLASALERLSDIERICFVLKHLEQWRLKEIAEELDTNIGTVKQAVFRATRKLRVAMASLQGESS